MDWLGIGVLIIGIALFVLVIVLIKPLLKLATVLNSVQKSTDRLPKILDDSAKNVHTTFQNVNKTLENVNEQVNAVHPLFQIVEDAGQASREVTSKFLNKSTAFKENTVEAKAFAEENKYGGLYGILSFIFYLSQNKDEITNASKQLKK